MRRDVEAPADVRAAVVAFYDGIGRDPDLGRFFAATDPAAHVARMTAFWCAVAFQTGGYHGRPLIAHAALDGIAPHHFEAWLGRFDRTLDARFAGPVADRMKRSAKQIAGVFQARLGLAGGSTRRPTHPDAGPRPYGAGR